MWERLVWSRVLCVAISSIATTEALPQTPTIGTEFREFAIRSEDAGAAIRDFGRQTGIGISGDWNSLQGVKFAAVQGRLSIDEALHRLLAGTGLTYAYISERSVVIIAGHPLDHSPSSQEVPQANDPNESGKLNEIVVSAQRRAENRQDVPISAQVIKGDDLAAKNLNSLNEVSGIVPSVHIGSNSRSANLYIRGIGSGESQTFSQSVAVFSDDVYHGRARMSGATFLDIDQIEILKGPQSIFFGNNAIAGSINIISNRPSNNFDLSARNLYGEHGQYAAETAISGPLNDVLSSRLAATANGTGGWLNNQSTGRKVPAENNVAGRITFLLKPNENFDGTWKIEGGRNRNVGALALQDVECPPPPPFSATGFCKIAIGLKTPMGINNEAIAQNSGQENLLNTSESVLTFNYRQWDHTFTSVSGYYAYNYNENEDTDGTPLKLFNIQAPESYHQFSEELRVASAINGPSQYLAGVYFHTDNLSFSHKNSYFFLTPTLEASPALTPLAPYLPLGQVINFSEPERTYSIFGSATWRASDRVTLGAGIRASRITEAYDWNLYYGTASEAYGGIAPLPGPQAALAKTFANTVGLGNPNTLSGSRADQALMPSARIQYAIDPNAMAYATFNRGSKGGGYNGSDTTGAAKNLPFSPEHVNAYELGLKNELLNHRVLLNVDIFRSDYTDLQTATNIGTPSGSIESLVRNAASSRSQGAEVETAWLITNKLQLSAEVTYDDARYIRYPHVGPTQLQQYLGLESQDLSGRPTEFAPRWDGSLTGSYTLRFPPGYQLTSIITGIFSSAYFLTGNDDPTVTQGDYLRLDASISLETVDQRWTIDVLGKNLTDRSILTFGIPWPTAAGSVWLQKEEPRNIALQVRFHW